MKKIVLFLFIFSIGIYSCKKNEGPEPDTYEYFKAKISADMSFTSLQSVFGTPDGDIGSGIHIYVYNLSDGTFIWIGYANQIMYVRHMDSGNGANAKLLHTII